MSHFRTVPTENMGSGSADNTKFLRGDNTWATPASGPAGQAFPVGSVFTSVVATDPATLLGYGTWAALAAGRVLVGFNAGDADFDTVKEVGGAKAVASSAQAFAGSALAAHQHAAVSAGTPAGTNSAPAFTGNALGTHQHELPLHGGTTPRITAGYGTGSSIAGTRALTNTAQTTAQAVLLDKATSAGTPSGSVSAPTFTGSAMATHQHAAISAGTPAGTNTPGAATSVVQPYLVVYFWERTA